MRRVLISLSAVLALVTGVIVASALPASAATNITATSVALGASAGCATNANLDVGLVGVTTDTETGLVTNAAGEVLHQFDQAGNWDGFDGVFDYGLPLDVAQADGTIIGAHAAVGLAPLSSTTAAEWFVLFQCGSGGGTEVLYSCFGDLGTCPTTAVEALQLLAFGASLDPSTVAPGGTVTVNGTNCLDQLAGAILFDGDTPLGVGDTVAPNPDGSFSIPLVVPATVAPGTTLTVQVDCGSEEGGITDTVDLPLQVIAPTTTSEPPAVAAEVTPAFTG